MNKLLVTMALSIFISSCGGGGGESGENNPPPQTTQSSGGVELGPVKGASVAIQALDGYTLVTSITDNSGFFKIDIDELKSAVDSYGSNLKFVKIISTGGIDIDPDDDGVIVESEQIEVKGNVKGIIPLNTLYQSKDYRINFISTALVDILGSEQNVSDEQISYIIKRLGISDINEDGKIDIDDITSYRMSEHNSTAETDLRDGFLEYIHDGNTESRKLFIEDLKYDVGFSRPLITKKDGYYEVNLSKTNKDNTMYYGIVADENHPSYQEYYGQPLSLNYGTAIFYQECSDDYGCYKLQKIFFYAEKYYLDYDYEPINDNYDEVQKQVKELDDMREKKKQAQKEIQKIKEKINVLVKVGEIFGGSSNGNP